MTKTEAFQLDKKGALYVEPVYEDPLKDWGVFGSESGFCYSIWSCQSAAELELERLSQKEQGQ